MRHYYKPLVIAVFVVCFLSGCKNNPEEKLKNIEVSEIEKIECKGDTGEKVDRNRASSSGASFFFTLYFSDGQNLKFSPMHFFYLDGTYYEFENHAELNGSFSELRYLW